MNKTNRKRILIASGGTGGHFYPGLALADALRAKGGWEPVFLVKKGDSAIDALRQNYYPYAELDMVALPRSLNPLAHLGFLYKFASSLAACLRILKDTGPVLVFGTGSYISFPAILAAFLKGTPSMIHESNAKFGLGNGLCARFASHTTLGLPVKNNPFGAATTLTGTPVRNGFLSYTGPLPARASLGLKEEGPLLLIFGGSQGALRLNRAAAAAVKKLKAKGLAFQVIHLAGKNDYAGTLAFYSGLGLSGAPYLKVLPYSEEMNLLYAAAGLVCCRSGAGTVAELLYLKKPAVLVPLPTSAGGHQLENARVLADAGTAVVVEQSPAFDAELAAQLERLIGSAQELERMRSSFSGLAYLPDPGKAAENIIIAIEKLIS
ncbi:MAG: UDP-N-acetylglucosamine--N-acetylmuramyl-(pentapeptide) pyrophosphoryl-undecaprenol N-acetylglucosamine transferase [Elusimicrobiales bacterium]|jgi:UDP-N-acetylglucosamine--N-acetylmuramyl-(pentapeptide) pyrophosphoryl-undecaprenol N-acetylglucosamine transferase